MCFATPAAVFAPAQQRDAVGPPSVADFVDWFGALADPRRLGEASVRLERGARLADHAGVRRGADAIVAAVRRAREDVARPYRAWFELTVASRLTDIGLYGAAYRGLCGFLDGNGEPLPHEHHLVAASWSLRAELALARGEFQGALDAACAARAACAEVPAEHRALLLSEAVGVHGRIFVELSAFGRARRLLDEQASLVAGLGDPVARSRSAQYRAELFLAQDRGDKAREALAELGEPHELSAVLRVAYATALFSDSLRQAGRGAERAEAMLRAALGTARLPHGYALRARLTLVRSAVARGAIDAAEAELATLRSMVSGEPDTQMNAELEGHAARLARARFARGQVSRSDLERQRERLRGAFDALLQHWRNTPLLRSGNAFFAINQRRAIVSELIELERVLAPVRAPTAAARLLLLVQSLTTSSREQHVAATSLEEVRARFLGERDCVWLFLLSLHESHLVVVERGAARLFRVAGWAEAADAIREFRIALSQSVGVGRGGLERQRQRARALGRLLLPAAVVAELGRFSCVTIADHGTLYGAPWECLATGDDALLGESVAVNNLSSLGVGIAALARHRAAPRGRARIDVLATLAARGETAAHPLVERDLAPLVDGYATSRFSLNDAVTRAAVRDRRFDATVTQVLAHGVEERSREVPAGLLLHDGFFGAAEIDPRDDVSGLIVLSSCRSARAKPRLGEEPYYATLGGAFLRAGAHTVIQSRADLELGAHVDLLHDVHAGLLAGVPPAEAVRTARVAAREDGEASRFQHGQVQVFGLGHLPVVAGERR